VKINGEFIDAWEEQNSLSIAIYVIALRRLLASCDKVRRERGWESSLRSSG
jgi:hypothetical protein